MTLNQIITNVYSIEESSFHGVEESIIKDIEEKLKLFIPETLRKFYLLYGNIQDINFYDELFKPQDIFIDNIQDTQFMVIGMKYTWTEFYGININDLHENNPAIYRKKSVRTGDTFKHEFIWQKYETVERFLLRFIIDNGIRGGLNYRFDTHVFDDVENIAALINNKQFNVEIINEISFSNSDTTRYCYYYIGETFIMELFYLKEHNGKMGYFYYGTNNKDVFQDYFDKFKKHGIKVCKGENKTNEYKIHKEKNIRSEIIGLTIIPGSYKNWRERRHEAIRIPEESVHKFLDLLHEVNKDFDYYGITTEYSKKQITQLIELLSARVTDMKNNEDFMFRPCRKSLNYNDYYYSDNVEYRKYKKQIIKMIMDFIDWLGNVKEDRINIIGV